MASQIHPRKGRVVQVMLKNEAGMEGMVEGALLFTMVPEGMATLDVADDQKSYTIWHSGPVGVVKVQIAGDGDLLPGEDHQFALFKEDEFEMLAPLGASAIDTVVGDEIDAPVV